MDLLSTVILGVIEGITEFLPISSTGHLLIAEHWLGERSEIFNVVIQSGAMLAMTLIYWRRLVALALGWREAEMRAYLGKEGGGHEAWGELSIAFVVAGLTAFVAVK